LFLGNEFVLTEDDVAETSMDPFYAKNHVNSRGEFHGLQTHITMYLRLQTMRN
jgi:hypothetical protein